MANVLPIKLRRLILADHTVSSFFGANTILSDIYTMPDGYSPDAINWITGDERDCIILRRGTALLGTNRQTDAGKITGLEVGTRVDGVQVPFFTRGRKIFYYDLASNTTIEVGTDTLPAAANGEEISIAAYQNLAGAFVFLSSINTPAIKIPVANPGSAVQQNTINYKGFLKFGQSRAILFNQHGQNSVKDVTGLYMSWVDRVLLNNFMTSSLVFTGVGLNDASCSGPSDNLAVGSTYTVVIDGNGTPDTFKWQKGSGSFTTGVPITAGVPQYLADNITVTFATSTGHTINDKWVITSAYARATENIGSAGDTTVVGVLSKIAAPSTAFQVSVTATVAAGTETFKDDGSGNLASNFGGTGTINYATGAVSATFSDVTTGQPTTTYYWEDATNHGVLDFTTAYDQSVSPATRIAGSGRYFAQFDGGGPLQACVPLANVFYSFHTKKTWQTSIPTNDDDTSATPSSNLPFRELTGVSSPYSAEGSSLGIYYINNANPARPEVYQLQPRTGATSASLAAPKLISAALNLGQSYAFDHAVLYVWNIYALLSCQQIRDGFTDDFNSRTFVMNTRTGAWDLTDYPATRLREYMGSLISGDPLSNNVFTLFSGFDDDGSLIPNYWTSGYTNHGVPGVKTTMRMVVNGLIQSSQRIQVSVSYDGGAFVDVFTIEGDGSYVDRSRSISVGQNTVGSKINGGGGEVFANPFEVEFGLNSDRYEYIRVRFEALNGGYAQINYYTWKINRYKGERVPNERIAS